MQTSFFQLKKTGAGAYRYGFNGKENDDDVKGIGNQQDYGMRIYDPRLGRFLSVDPLMHEYPWNSTYAFAENDPINFIDIDGAEKDRPARPGTRGGRSIGYVEEMARNTGMRAREGARIQREQQARQEALRQGRLTPEQRGNEGNLKSAISNYLQNALLSANYTFTGGNSVLIQKNRASGNFFENEVNRSMLSNPDYKNVARQVTFAVESTNGLTLRIRVDNVGIRKDGTLDLVEAKFSINSITKNNVTQTLTPNQKDFFKMVISGDVASIKFVGGPTKTQLMNMPSGTEVSGKINSIQIVPSTSNSASASSSSGNSNNSSNAQTNPHKKTDL